MTGDITTALSEEQAAMSDTQIAMSAENTALSSEQVLNVPNRTPSGTLAKIRGFTLIELMVVIVIVAILLTLAVPAFDNMIRRNTVESLQTSLGGALTTARTEAAARNSVVTICAINDEGNNCSDDIDDWGQGWLVFVDQDADGTVDDEDVIIEVFEYDGRYTFTPSVATGPIPSSLSFNSQGFLREATPTLFTICDPRGNEEFARGMFVNNSGLVMKTARPANGGVHSNPLGGTLGC